MTQADMHRGTDIGVVSAESTPGEFAAIFLDERPGAMELPILTEDEIAEVVKELRARLARRPCAAEERA